MIDAGKIWMDGKFVPCKEKKINVLLTYAEKMGLRDEIMKYVEIMI